MSTRAHRPALTDALLEGRDEVLKGLYNEPGLKSLRYRCATFHTFLLEMLDALLSSEKRLASTPAEVVDERSYKGRDRLDESQKRRIRVNLTEDDNWLVGLLKSWATVGDVLTFYQERIANEGYFATARERLSIHELVRMLDVRPLPGVGGIVHVAFSASDVDGLPRRVKLARRHVVHCTPPDGGTLVFETSEPLVARSDWNLVRPSAPVETAPPVLRGETTRVSLEGAGHGLEAGSAILVTGRIDGEELRAFRLLSAVETSSGDRATSTEIRWSEALDEERGESVVEGAEVFALRQSAALFGAHAPLWQEQPLEVRRRYRPIEGGVRLLAPPEPWKAINEDLPSVPVRCLAFDAQGNLFAGTAGQGVYRRLADADTWRESDRGVVQLDVRCLAADPRGAILAGTADGDVYRSTDQGEIWTLITGRAARATSRWRVPSRTKRLQRLPETAVRTLWAAPKGAVSHLFAGTDSGVYHSEDLGNSWQPRNKGLPGVDGETGETDLVIEVLASPGPDAPLYAGTSGGVFKTRNRGRKWQSVSRGLPDTDPLTGVSELGVRALLAYTDQRRRAEHLLVATAKGLFRSADAAASWQSAQKGLPRPGGRRSGGRRSGEGVEIVSLAVLDDPITVTIRLFAGSSQGLWVSEDHGESWSEVELGSPGGVESMAVGPRGARLAAASPFGGFAQDEWPSFFVSGGRIDLEAVVSGIPERSWVALASDAELEDAPPPRVERVEKVSTIRRRDFTLDARVTRMQVESDPEHRLYGLRPTQVWVRSELLPLKPRQLPPDPELALASLRSVLQAMAPERPVIATGVLVRESGEAAAAEVTRPTYVHVTTAGELHSELAEATGQAPLLLTARRPAIRSDVAAEAEKVRVYPLTLQVRGNVAETTEGATMRDETLGDGVAARALQRFPLRQPLAYERGAPRPRASIEVRVQGHRWTEVPRLYGQDGESQVYEVELDSMGNATVVFGDGVHGARLPSGAGNVVATYRTGMTHGELPAGTVTLTTKPLGLAQATNPVAGTPGTPAEPGEEVVARAPTRVRTFGRIVSVCDYEDFSLDYPGVVKATAAALKVRGFPAVQVTVATWGETHRPGVGSELLDRLRQAIDEVRSSREPVYLAAYEEVRFGIDAAVRLQPTYAWDDVRSKVLVALEQRFGFDRSRFGDAVRGAEVIRVIQEVEGVRAVDLNDLLPHATQEPLELRPRPAWWDKDAVGEDPRPAELIVFDPGLCKIELRGEP